MAKETIPSLLRKINKGAGDRDIEKEVLDLCRPHGREARHVMEEVLETARKNLGEESE